jgi:hypothetical protein
MAVARAGHAHLPATSEDAGTCAVSTRCAQVSSNARLRDECLKGAKFLARQLESLGADVKVVR